MKRLLPIAAAALLLVGCGSNPEVPAESTTVETTTTTTASITTSTTTSTEPTSTTSAQAPEPSTPQAEAAPGANTPTPANEDLIPTPNQINGHGVYLDPNTGTYYYCNTTQLTWDGTPPGSCAGPYNHDEANNKFSAVVEQWYNDSLVELDMPTPQDSTFSYCSGDGIGMYTDGNEHPYPDCALPAPPITETSPWVQGQIDWQNCLDAGNTEQYCRETLN